jgi:hypothetical protein
VGVPVESYDPGLPEDNEDVVRISPKVKVAEELLLTDPVIKPSVPVAVTCEFGSVARTVPLIKNIS